MPYGLNKETGRPGPTPKPGRDGDKLQARARVNAEVKAGRMPRPDALACADCGHVCTVGGRRHEYDHHLGYAAAHHLDVESVCTSCHSKRDNPRGRQTHCKRGHEFITENTIIRSNGTRECRECRRIRDRRRRNAAYWREYRQKKEAARG